MSHSPTAPRAHCPSPSNPSLTPLGGRSLTHSSAPDHDSENAPLLKTPPPSDQENIVTRSSRESDQDSASFPKAPVAVASVQGNPLLATPARSKPGRSQRHNTSEGAKQDNTEQRMLWWKVLLANFRGELAVDEFFRTYLPRPPTETDGLIDAIVAKSGAAFVSAAKDALAAGKEVDYDGSLVKYFNAVASQFPTNTRPSFKDTHSIMFPPIDEDDHPTAPDVIGGKPGAKIPDKPQWLDAGVIIELKVKVDIFNSGEINPANKSLDALAQIGKSARSLLASGNCFVFVVTVFKTRARILRFDRAGFRTSVAFDWTRDSDIFPTLFWRLYNPDPAAAPDFSPRMYGQDDTISIPTAAEKNLMFKAWQQTSSYKDTPLNKRFSFEEATVNSRWVDAVKGDRHVRCFTIGPPLFQSEGLFSRATRVDRVVLETDKSPTVYALKDAWRQVCRRPETDFYDVIAKHCEESGIPSDGMAKCLGSLEVVGPRHRTNSAASNQQERCHTRSLLTPVGLPLKNFTSTLALVQALQTAIQHHRIAYEAGVIHRDVSEGNVLFDESSMQGFLVDWDYAEFTAQGQINFENWFPARASSENNRTYVEFNKSLKDLTGTFAFMAIQILKHKVIHEAKHDLESFYYLLVWMVLRYTPSDAEFDKPRLCHELFDNPALAAIKRDWLSRPTAFCRDHPLYDVVDTFRKLVRTQNPEVEAALPSRISMDIAISASPAVNSADVLTYDRVTHIFKAGVALPNWPSNDAAIPFVPHAKIQDGKSETKSKTGTGTGADRGLRRTAMQNSQAAREVSEGAAGGSKGTKRRRQEEAMSELLTGEIAEAAPKKPRTTPTPTVSGSSKDRQTASARTKARSKVQADTTRTTRRSTK